MPKPLKAQTRLATLAAVLETDMAALESFLDLLAEAPMDDRRIADAQWVLGLCCPIASHLTFPLMPPPAVGKELLAEWRRRQKIKAAADDAERHFESVFEALAEGAVPTNMLNPTQADEEGRIRQIRTDHGVFE